MANRMNSVLVLAFCGLLLAPTAASIFGFSPMSDLNENRALAARPATPPLAWSSVDKVPKLAEGWEKYFNDHFGLRQFLIGAYRLGQFRLLGISPTPAVVVGKSDGQRTWLFYNASVRGDGVGFESTLGKRPYNQAELDRIALGVRAMFDLAKRNGIPTVLAVFPDKQSVHTEYLPREMVPGPHAISRLDQFLILARSSDDLPILDLRAPMREAAKKGPVYFARDTHLDHRAAFLTYRIVAQALEKMIPGWKPIPEASVNWVPAPPVVRDLTVMMGLPWQKADPQDIPVYREPVPIEKRGKLLVLGDSFSEYWMPYLLRQFQTVKRISAVNVAGRTILTQELLNAEKPEAIIVESLERYWTM